MKGRREFQFFYSADIPTLNVRVRPLKLTPSTRASSVLPPSSLSSAFIVVQLWGAGHALSLPLRTRYSPLPPTGWHSLTWDEWLEFPVAYADLPPQTSLVVTAWAPSGPGSVTPLGSASLPLFSSGALRKGKHGVVLTEGALPDPVPRGPGIPTPQLELGVGEGNGGEGPVNRARVEKRVQMYDQGEVVKIPWLDHLAFAIVHEGEEERLAAGEGAHDSVLTLEFVSFDHPVLPTPDEVHVELTNGPPPPRGLRDPSNVFAPFHDPAAFSDAPNPVEAKHRKLARSHRKGFLDANLKPNSAERRDLHAIITAPPTAPISDDQSGLLWKFRYSLISNPRALGPFLRTIEWDDASEVDVVAALLPSWARISVEQALELLAYSHPAVRSLALDVLDAASDSQILAFLLQLVQCLRYSPHPGPESPLGRFLLSRALANPRVGNFLVWYLQVECEDKEHGVMFHNFIVSFESSLNKSHASLHAASSSSTLGRHGTRPGSGAAAATTTAATGTATAEDPLSSGTLPVGGTRGGTTGISTAESITSSAVGLLSSALSFVTGDSSGDTGSNSTTTGTGTSGSSSPAVSPRFEMIGRQRNLLANLNALYSELRKGRDRKKNITRLRAGLVPTGEFSELASFPPVMLPVNPDVVVTGLVPEGCTLLKSALTPILLTFNTVGGEPYKVLFKAGDDPRQDQLIIQLIQLMDSLLRKEALDLKLLPYAVLAASSNDGLFEFVDGSHNVSQVIKQHKSGILGFFRKVAPDPATPLGVSHAVLDTYARSCAGYCVITYILAVGDRHLDNLLLTDSGQLFHIDFGYILGKDPKPLPPPMKLSKEMVEALGGSDSEHYSRFISYCCESFNIFRKSAHLILNLLRLMVDANIPDLSSQPERALRRVQDNFRLDLTDEEAIQYFQNLINDSVSALAPQIAETFHRVAMYWKS